MPSELSDKCAPTSPHCPTCTQVMRLARITSRFADLPDLYTFECRAWRHIAHRGSVNATIVIMVVAIVRVDPLGNRTSPCPLLGVKRASVGGASMSAFDPRRT